MSRKRYRLKLFPQTTYEVTLKDGRTYPVRFGNANLLGHSRQNGYFTTEDEDLQKAIESDPQYNKLFYLDVDVPSGNVDIKIEPEEPVSVPPEEDDNSIEKVEATTGEEETAKEVEKPSTAGITNSTNAKEYLRKYYNVSTGDMANAAAIKAKAVELGVGFPDWK